MITKQKASKGVKKLMRKTRQTGYYLEQKGLVKVKFIDPASNISSAKLTKKGQKCLRNKKCIERLK